MYIVAHNAARVLGGGEIGTALLLRGLQERGHRVLMLCQTSEMAVRVSSYGIPADVQRVGGDVMISDALFMAGRLRRERPDAVILTTFKKVLLTGLACRLARVPFVVQRIVLQGDTPSRGARYRYALSRLVDMIVLNADAMRAAFLADASPGTNVITITDGVSVPPRTAASGSIRRELRIPDTAFVIGTVARFARQKRLDRLMHAIARVPQPVHCVIAGEGAQLEPTRALATELGIAERVHFTGFRTDIGDILGALDLFVISSDREGMANAMLEAMASGLPVVSTDVSGAREALAPFAADGSAAGIVTGFDDTEFADAIARLAGDEALRSSLAREARRRGITTFGVERFLDDWENLLSSRGRIIPGAAVGMQQ